MDNMIGVLPAEIAPTAAGPEAPRQEQTTEESLSVHLQGRIDELQRSLASCKNRLATQNQYLDGLRRGLRKAGSEVRIARARKNEIQTRWEAPPPPRVRCETTVPVASPSPSFTRALTLPSKSESRWPYVFAAFFVAGAGLAAHFLYEPSPQLEAKELSPPESFLPARVPAAAPAPAEAEFLPGATLTPYLPAFRGDSAALNAAGQEAMSLVYSYRPPGNNLAIIDLLGLGVSSTVSADPWTVERVDRDIFKVVFTAPESPDLPYEFEADLADRSVIASAATSKRLRAQGLSIVGR